MTDSSVYKGREDNPTSSGLLVRVKANDQAAWNRLADLYGPLVYHWCRRAGIQRADAHDIGQEVFKAVARKIGAFRRDRAGDSFRGWLRTITNNKIRDHHRRKHKELTGMTDKLRNKVRFSLPHAPPHTDDADSEERGLLGHQAVLMVQAECEPRSWQAFYRVAVDGAKPADVAMELQMTVNAVYVAKSRIARRLREEFGELADIPD